MRKLYCVLALLLCCFSFPACKFNCIHDYSLVSTVDATCSKKGYQKYECKECGDSYKETIETKAHIPGEAPTLDTAQTCIVCGSVLADAVAYMPYRNHDLIINEYRGYPYEYVVTDISHQNQERYQPGVMSYTDKSGVEHDLNLDIPVQDFFTHSVRSVLPLTTTDGKTYTTDSGFKLAFTFSATDKDVSTIRAWKQGLRAEFKDANKNLLKIVGEYKADPAFYNNVYELVDFSNSYIEVAKQTENGYETIKKISSQEAWSDIFERGKLEIANIDEKPFYEKGTYRILFKYNMTWITDSSSVVYASDDVNKENPVYPYGKLNDQYEFFYVTVTDEKNNVLLPSSVEAGEEGLFSQLRILGLEENAPFIAENTTLNFKSSVVFNIGAKVDMTKKGYYYNQRQVQKFSFVLSVYNKATDSYEEYEVYDLMHDLKKQTVYGEEITLDMGRDVAIRNKKCRITISSSFFDESSGATITEKQTYDYILHW